MFNSEKTISILQANGWVPSKKQDISKYENFYKDSGYTTNSVVMDFLSQFGGLEVEFKHPKLKNEVERFHLNPEVALSHIDKEIIEEYEEIVNENLLVVGEAYRGHMTLLMSSSGKVFAGYDDVFVKLGDNGYEALETLCELREPTTIPV